MLFAIFFSLECVTLFGALWLYALKFYEAATDIERMMMEEELNPNSSRERKRRYSLLRWIIFSLISIPILILNITAAIDRANIDERTVETLVFIGFVVLTIFSLSTTVLLAMIQCKLYRVVSRMEATRDSLNCTFITVQILGLAMYMAEWIGECVVFIVQFSRVQ